METVLLVDDDEAFRNAMVRALARRGLAVTAAGDAAAAEQAANIRLFDFAVIDLRMPGPSGLVLVSKLRALQPALRIVVLTGYASIATAVQAIKLGAVNYLTKPADADEVLAAFGRADGNAQAPIAETIPSTRRMQWEHIQRILAQCDGNVSAAARRLGMHRRTLQRQLAKRPVAR